METTFRLLVWGALIAAAAVCTALALSALFGA
jgi:hypothetical protein